MKKIAVLGLGAMGSRVAQNLLKANYPVVIYNRTTEKAQPLLDLGAVSAATPREAATQADVVISFVRDDEASRAVWLSSSTGAIMGLREDSVAIASSTLSIRWTQELAAEIKRRGAAFLDAPVVGSRPQAEAGKLIHLVGGKAETLARVQEMLSAIGDVQHVGDVGQGMAMKLAVNALFGIQVVALAEVVGSLSQRGFTVAEAIACLGELPIISPAAKGAGNLIAAHQHAPMFPIELVEKDFQYALDMAASAGADSPTVTAVRDVYGDAIAKGYGSQNITGIARLFI